MREKASEQSAVFVYGWAGLAVALMLLGRWTPDRLFQTSALELFWIAKAGALLVLTLGVAVPGMRADRRIPGLGLFLALMGFVFASYLWNPARNEYATSKIIDLGYNLVLLLVTSTGLCRAPFRNAFWPMLVSALGAMALIGVIMLPSASASIDGRLAVLGGGPNIFGRNMGLLIIACLFFGLHYPKVRIICAIFAAAATIGIIGSGSRGALGAWMVALLALFVLDPISRRFVLTRPLLMLSFAVFGGAVLLLADLDTVAQIGAERFIEQTLETGYLSMRDTLVYWAYTFWLEAPVFGNGLGSFSLVTELLYPHNILLEFLCETGVVGLAAFVIFASVSGVKQIKSGGKERALVLSVATLLAIAAQASGDFVDSRFLFLFLLYPIAIKVADRNKAAAKQPPLRAQPLPRGAPRRA